MTKGETLKLAVTDADAASVEFRFGGPQVKTVSATGSRGEWSISTSTAQWMAGFYAWQAWATYADGSRAIISTGDFQLADTLGIGDQRSTARKNVEAIESMLTKNAPEGVKKYKIGMRELERYSVAELLQLLSYWKRQVRTEERAEAGRDALGPRIAVRF